MKPYLSFVPLFATVTTIHRTAMPEIASGGRLSITHSQMVQLMLHTILLFVQPELHQVVHPVARDIIVIMSQKKTAIIYGQKATEKQSRKGQGNGYLARFITNDRWLRSGALPLQIDRDAIRSTESSFTRLASY